MNKGEFIEKLYERNGGRDLQSKAAAERVLNDVAAILSEGIVEDGSVRISDIGTFEIVKRSARNGINPQTKEPMKIKATKAVRFKPASALKDAVKKSKFKPEK